MRRREFIALTGRIDSCMASYNARAAASDAKHRDPRGINILNTELAAKKLELLRELVPGVTRLALFVNPTNLTSTETTLLDAEPAANAKGLESLT